MQNWQNHYDYLEAHLPSFLVALGIDQESNAGIIGAHGDKCRQYKDKWEENGITLPQGAAMCLISYIQPYAKECREQPDGTFVRVDDWVVSKKNQWLPLLEQIEKHRTQHMVEAHLTNLVGRIPEEEIYNRRNDKTLFQKGVPITKEDLYKLIPNIEMVHSDELNDTIKLIRKAKEDMDKDPKPLGENVVSLPLKKPEPTPIEKIQRVGRIIRTKPENGIELS